MVDACLVCGHRSPIPPPASSSLSNGAIAGIVIGIVLVLVLATIVTLVLLRRYMDLQKKTRKMTMDLVKMSEMVDSDMR